MLFEPKGTLSIGMEKKSYIPGEVVKGRVRLSLDNPVKARRFSVSLIGEEWVEVSCGSGKSRQSKKEEVSIHAEDIELSGEGMYGFAEKDFQFRIPENALPTIWMAQNSSAKTSKPGEWKVDYPLFGKYSSYDGGAGLRWIVKAKLDIPWGRDKNAREEIFVP
jgi:hypothetical protein